MVRYALTVVCLFYIGCVRGITVVERLNALERIIIGQAETLSQHESLFREHTEKINQQQEELKKIQNEKNVLKNRVDDLENEIEQLHKIHADDLDESNTPGTEDDKELYRVDVNTRRNSSIQNGAGRFYLQDRTQRRQALNTSSSEKVAFYAHSLATQCLHDMETLVFAVEDVDEGNGYNKDDGIYVVPVTGTYVFTWTTTARHDWYDSQLMVNGQARGNAYAEGSGGTELAESTGLVVTNVVVSDHVYIRRLTGYGCNVNQYSDVKYSSFAGWLLF